MTTEERWTSEHIHAAHKAMVLDLAKRAVWPAWFRDGPTWGHLFTIGPSGIDGVTVFEGGFSHGYLGRFAVTPDALATFTEWALARGSFAHTDYEAQRKHEARVAAYVEQPDPPVITWLRGLPDRSLRSGWTRGVPVEALRGIVVTPLTTPRQRPSCSDHVPRLVAPRERIAP